MNIVIFSGGTGSTALQTGLYNLFADNLDVTIITNTYDNGKSTGIVRKVLDGKINGPSDLRKNQILRYSLMGGNPDIIALMTLRFDCKSDQAEEMCIMYIEDLKNKNVDNNILDILYGAIKSYFSFPLAKKVDYIDFSIANIIYAGLAASNMSLAQAGKIMASKVLKIPENSVIVSDDNSLYLQARTESGGVILDEGDIVEWNNVNDKIVETFFTDPYGKETKPRLTDESYKAIIDADIIIFSAGTQWSSLIPTYQHDRFRDAIDNSSAFKYLVINNNQDKDMLGVDANSLLILLSHKYLSLENIKCIFNKDASLSQSVDKQFMLDNNFQYLNEHLSDEYLKFHDGKKLAKLIIEDYFGETLKSDTFIFDYDDTLVGRNFSYHLESKENKNLLLELNILKSVFICSGNSIKAISFNNCKSEKDLIVYAENGINKYSLKFKSDQIHISAPIIIAPESIISNKEVDFITNSLESVGINISKIQNRNNAMISIKPIESEYRKPLVELFKRLFVDYIVNETGRTTIDISKGVSKDIILRDIKYNKITYIGDEFYYGGNDYSLLSNPSINVIDVKSPKDTNVFLKTLLGYIKNDKREN